MAANAQKPDFLLNPIRKDGDEKPIIFSLSKSDRTKVLCRRDFLHLCLFGGLATLTASCASARNQPSTPTPVPLPTSTFASINLVNYIGSDATCKGVLASHSRIHSIAFSPDSKILASCEDSRLALWDINSGTLVKTLGKASVLSVAFSADGKVLAWTEDSGLAFLWDVASSRLLYTIGEVLPKGSGLSTSPIAIRSDSKVLAWQRASSLDLWDIDTGQLIKTLFLPFGQNVVNPKASSIAFSPDGKVLAAGGFFGLGLWDVDSVQLIKRIEELPAYTVVFSPADKMLAYSKYSATGGDSGIALWDVGTGQSRDLLKQNDIMLGAFSPDGKVLAASAGDSGITFWDVDSGQLLKTFGEVSPAGSIAFSPDGNVLAATSGSTIYLLRKGVTSCLFDQSSTSVGIEVVTYTVTDAYGITRTYVNRHGSWPAGAICKCVPVAGSFVDSGGSGGGVCSCVPVCVCMAV